MKDRKAEGDTAELLLNHAETLMERKPFLRETLRAFLDVMIAGAELREELKTLALHDIDSPDTLRLSAGVPLLSDMENLGKLLPSEKDGIKRMLAALEKAFPLLKADAAKLVGQLEQGPLAHAPWLEMLVKNDEDLLNKSAGDLSVEPASLRFILEQSLKPFMQSLACRLASLVEQITWDRGYCPICGAYPDTSYLKKDEDPGEYLVAHGGRRWLHCSLCSYEWRLHRIICPYCGNEDAETLEYLAAEEPACEKLYVCHLCKKYLPCLDTSELIEIPPADLIPFELLHLDLIAQEKGFTPMAWRQWNQMSG